MSETSNEDLEFRLILRGQMKIEDAPAERRRTLAKRVAAEVADFITRQLATAASSPAWRNAIRSKLAEEILIASEPLLPSGEMTAAGAAGQGVKPC